MIEYFSIYKQLENAFTPFSSAFYACLGTVDSCWWRQTEVVAAPRLSRRWTAIAANGSIAWVRNRY